jgi:hypothetical protein
MFEVKYPPFFVVFRVREHFNVRGMTYSLSVSAYSKILYPYQSVKISSREACHL